MTKDTQFHSFLPVAGSPGMTGTSEDQLNRGAKSDNEMTANDSQSQIHGKVRGLHRQSRPVITLTFGREGNWSIKAISEAARTE